jgi:predicted dehydrogenase
MTNIAFLGVAHIHTPGFIENIKNRPDTTITHIWDHDTDRAAKRAEETGATAVADFQTILDDPTVDAIIVCSETNRHEDLVIPTAQAGKHVFVEKPLGYGSSDAYEMAQAIEKAGVLFSTGYFMRGDTKINFLRDQINKGHFGKITRVRASNCHSGALGRWFDTEWRWMADPEQAGVGAFGDLGTHVLDILIWLFGDVEKATALLNNGTEAYEDNDETGEGLLQFTSGVIGTIAAAWDDIADPILLQISGTEGYAYILNGQLYFTSSHVEGADGKTPWTDLPAAKPAGLDAFLEAINGNKDVTLQTASEVAYRSAVMEALYDGAKGGWWAIPAKP